MARRHNLQRRGRPGAPPLLFAHGFGCDQQMWRFVAPAFDDTHDVVLFDHIGCGGSDASAYDDERHATLHGYAQDVVGIVEALDLREVVFVGHSVSAQIGMLAAIAAPARFSRLVLVGPSARYVNDPPDYVGGFERADIDALVDMMDRNLLGWANFLAPLVMDPQNPAELTQELRASLCASDPYITRRFAMTTFLSDTRPEVPRVPVPSLLIQCRHDAIAPPSAAHWLQQHLPRNTVEVLDAAGHCPHMTHPQATIDAMRRYLALG